MNMLAAMVSPISCEARRRPSSANRSSPATCRRRTTRADFSSCQSGLRTNSLVGTTSFQGLYSVTAFDGSGNYLVNAPDWSDLLGAVAWGNGSTGLVGQISATNALVGTNALPGVGHTVMKVGNGNALVTGDASVTLVRGTSPMIGPVSGENSAVNSFGHGSSSFDYDAGHDRLVVGWFLDNYVSVFQTESLLKNGFD